MRLRHLSAFALTVLIAACGGGGGSGGGSKVNAPPIANFTATPSSGGAPLAVSFDGFSSGDADGTITGYSWDFGDPSSSNNVAVGRTASHTYTVTGSYTVRLTVTDNSSATGERTGTITVTSTLSGHVRILPSSAIDSDVNDVNVPVVRNDTFDMAQVLPNPATVGGYLALPGVGEKGAVCAIVSASQPTCPTAIGDTHDFYKANLTGNETLLLSVAVSTADFDLKLYNDAKVLVDQTVGGMGTESLVVPTAGSYFVDVAAVSGGSNYVLSVGQTPVTAARAPRLSDEFVPGEIIVGGNAAPAAKHALRLAGASPGVRLMKFDTTRFANARNEARAFARNSKDAEKIATLKLMKAVAHDPAIAYAEPNYIRRPVATPNDAFYPFQWHYPNIQLPVAWDVIANGSLPNGDGVIVAVVDTGVLLNHPDLHDQILRNASSEVIGYDFISDPTRAGDGGGPDTNPDDPGDRAFGNSSSFHGTHVAGTIAAATNNTIGVAGIAQHAKIMPLRALGVDGGTAMDVIQAVRFAAGLSPNSSNTVPPRRADVINLSLSGGGFSQSEQATYDAVRAAGVIVVAAAGNGASPDPSYPAAYSGVVSVAATTITKTQATYSNSGPTIDVSAPGGNNATDVNGDGLGDGVVSTIGDDSGGSIQFGYAALSGTSMSAPHVAGVVALMKAIFPQLTVAQFESALASGQLTDDLGAIGRDDLFGIGLINAQKAVLRAIELKNGSGTPTSPVLTTSPTSLNFGAFQTELLLEVRNAGGGTLSVTPAIPAETWLSIDPATPFQLAAGASTTLTINVDRTALSDNTYSGEVTLNSTTNDVTVPIVMQVTSLDIEANAGKHYVILIDAGTGESVPGKIDIVEAANGEYPFSITGVADGQYRLAAGTDSDNDNFLCDAGEACGFYRTLDSPDTIVLSGDDGDVADLDFTSGFRVNLSSPSMSAASTPTVRRPEPVR